MSGNAEDMRGRREKPHLVIYRPGSGPLRKSAPEEDSTNNSPDNHLRTNFDPGSDDWRRNSKVTHEPFKTLTNERRAQPPRRSNLTEAQSPDSLSDLRRKSRKPEQAIYVPKPLAQAIAERDDFAKPSSSVSGRGSRTDTGQEEKWDKEDAKRSQPSNPRGDRYNMGAAERPGLKAGEDRPQRSVEGERPLWRAESPREVRQASEPRSLPPDIHRTRDTRSVEPSGRWTGDKGQAKPPSGRRGSRDGMGPKSHPCYDTLPPRLKKKYLAENMISEPTASSYIGTNSEAVWDGSTVTFQGSSGVNYRPHTLPLPHYPPGPQPPRSENWYQTLPAPSTRGRGRLRPEDLELERLESAVGRMSCTFPQEAASGANIDRTPTSTPPPVRTETPSAGYALSHGRNYQHPVLPDVRNYHHPATSSNDKMYQHGGTAALPSDGRNYHHGASTGRGHNTGARTQTHPIQGQDSRVPSNDVRVQYPHESKPTVNNQNLYSSAPSPAPRQQNNASNSCENTAPSLPATVEERAPLRELSSPLLDWSEEVELSERLEAEAAVSDAMTRSSSLVSLFDSDVGGYDMCTPRSCICGYQNTLKQEVYQPGKQGTVVEQLHVR
uniref:Uncharacterized protein n=1 Tax=Timema cristinae TaxID=61476 RepID=A0A7R9DDX2_TIMCR|nr:unnamed protein product [Timema cristinae]